MASPRTMKIIIPNNLPRQACVWPRAQGFFANYSDSRKEARPQPRPGQGRGREAATRALPRALTANRRSTLATMMETELAEAPTTATTRSGGAARTGGTPPGQRTAASSPSPRPRISACTKLSACSSAYKALPSFLLANPCNKPMSGVRKEHGLSKQDCT